MEQKYFNECVAFALNTKKINASSLEDAGMRVFYNQSMNTETVFSALGKGGIIMPILKGEFVGSNEKEVMCLLVSADHLRETVSLYIPTTKEINSFNRDTFMAAWNENDGLCSKAFFVDEQTYQPELINTDDIVLPDELHELCEKMAEQAHNVWAIERQSQGWTYGLQRDDSKLITPDMVPYAKLAEGEKEYDRKMSMGTLKLLYALGYKVVKA